MTNWKDIHENFTDKLQKEWENFGFVYEQVEEWISFGLQPTEADFAAYLGERGYTVEEMEENELKELKVEYNEVMAENISDSFCSKEVILSDKNWENVHLSFTPELADT